MKKWYWLLVCCMIFMGSISTSMAVADKETSYRTVVNDTEYVITFIVMPFSPAERGAAYITVNGVLHPTSFNYYLHDNIYDVYGFGVLIKTEAGVRLLEDTGVFLIKID